MDQAEAILVPILLGALWVGGAAMTVVRLPGIWLILGGAILHGWWTGFEVVTGTFLAILVGVALMAELVDFALGLFLVRRGGAHWISGWVGLLGSVVGVILLSPGGWLIGGLLGAVLGCFGGTALAELIARRRLGQGIRAGWRATVGFALGSAIKLTCAVAVGGAVMFRVLWGGASP